MSFKSINCLRNELLQIAKIYIAISEKKKRQRTKSNYLVEELWIRNEMRSCATGAQRMTTIPFDLGLFTTKMCYIQRIATNKNELQPFTQRFTANRLDQFKTVVAPSRTQQISATSNEFSPTRIRMHYNAPQCSR